MNMKYNEYIEAGTKKLMEFLSSPDVDDEEGKAVVSAFSNELSDNIANTSKLVDGEQVIYSASIKYIDAIISKNLIYSDLSYKDYEKAIKYCAREKQILQLFYEKKWTLPDIRNTDINKCEEILRKKQDTISLGNKIINEDHKIDELVNEAQEQLKVKSCDEALALLNELSKDIEQCKQNKTEIPQINNKDTKETVKKINKLRKNAEKKEELHQNIHSIDAQISGLASLPKTTPQQWAEIISLCQKQSELLMECTKKSWPLPEINCKDPNALANKYKHYQLMGNLDQYMVSNRNSLSGEKQYKAFFDSCTQQANNIGTCKKNKWKVPELNVVDPIELSKIVQDEKISKDKIKKRKGKIVKAAITVIAIIALIIFISNRYKEGKVRIPFDNSYVSGNSLELINEELENAGFTNIQKTQDLSGWLDDNEVINVTIDNKDSYNKGSYIKPDVSVVVNYSSIGRVYVTDLLDDWKDTDYKTIEKKLKDAGFTNIDLVEVDTLEKTEDTLVSNLNLNGIDYSNQHCYLPKNAPIIISYYSLKVGIGNNSAEFIGQDYETVVKNLKNSGFTNVQTEKINTGWAKGNTVVGVTVNNVDTYDSSQSFDPDVKIVVKYSSNDRTDATSAFADWNTKSYEALQTDLKNKGFSNVTLEAENTDNKSVNNLVAGIIINSEKYEVGDCFIQKNAEIVIHYYELQIVVGESASSLTSNTSGKYSSVVSSLKDQGFTNIQVYRQNDLFNGWLTKEGSISSISINGNNSFSETDSFAYDAPIIIVVHTFENSGCEDITLIAE